MKSAKRIFLSFWPCAAMLVLILDAKTALAGAQDGIELCIRTVVPSLFPFLFLSVMTTGSMLANPIMLLRPLGRICRIPQGCEGILAVGLLGGYPVGAQCVAQAYRDGRLSRGVAHRMLGFCSNAGPSFIFGILSGVFMNPIIVWCLWGIHILSAILTGILLPGGSNELIKGSKTQNMSVTDALERSLKIMSNICGWVVVFRVLLTFLQRWFFWMLPNEAAITISGLLELTNGCCSLSLIHRESTRFVLASVLLAFGGLCVGLQTASVTRELGTGSYFPGKLLQAGISYILSCLIIPILFPVENYVLSLPLLIPVVAAALVLIRKICKNHSSNLLRQGV